MYWLQCGGGGGDTMALLSMETPNVLEHLELVDTEVLGMVL